MDEIELNTEVINKKDNSLKGHISDIHKSDGLILWVEIKTSDYKFVASQEEFFVNWEIIKLPDLVNHPPHYNKGKYEVIDVIEDWDLGYHLSNVIKYVARSPHKGNQIQDLEKAKWYLERYINELKTKN